MASILNVREIESTNNILTTESQVGLSLKDTNSYLLLPKGTESQRYQNVSAGAMRWNIDQDQIEVYNGNLWRIARKILDFYRIKGNFSLDLDAANDEISYPGFGRKWFTDTFEPVKTIFSEDPVFNSSNNGFIEFNGSTTYSTTEIKPFLSPQVAITQECWFKTLDNTKTQELISLQYGISTNNSYVLYINGSSWNAGVNIAGTFNNIQHPFSSTPLVNNQWYNFVHTYNSNTFSFGSQGKTQAGSNIIEIVNGNFDYIVGMSITSSGIPDETTITSIDVASNTITISNPADISFDNLTLTCSLSPHQILYVNGEVVSIAPLTGTIEYTPENTLLTIGAGFEGPGINTGINNFLNGAISVVRLGGTFVTPSQIRTNYNLLKQRYGL